MRITDVRLTRLHGSIPQRMTVVEERSVGPLDLFPEFRAQGVQPAEATDALVPISAVYVEIDTQEGITGVFGPIFESQAYHIARQLRPLLLGRDPLEGQLLWELMARSDRHTRRGQQMMAISAVDIALWDLRGKEAGKPVYRLLGGPTRETVPAYASALGYSLEPQRVRERATALREAGFRAQKWFFRYGPASGREALSQNMLLVETLRETLGDGSDLMFDAWMGWDGPFAIEMGQRMAPYHPRWLEEPVGPDRIGAYAEIRRRAGIPIAGGEHEYTRWGFKPLLDAEGIDVVQADPDWTGGITELVKICAMVAVYGKQVIPHGHSVLPALQVVASQPASVCPLLEFLLAFNPSKQWFHEAYVGPGGGMV